MNLPIWSKPALIGACVGGIAVSIIGFSWGGWVTAKTADELASSRAHAEVMSALTPVCMANSAADPERATTFDLLKEAGSYRRPQIVMDAGWATMPGVDTPNRDVAATCASHLMAKL